MLCRETRAVGADICTPSWALARRRAVSCARSFVRSVCRERSVRSARSSPLLRLRAESRMPASHSCTSLWSACHCCSRSSNVGPSGARGGVAAGAEVTGSAAGAGLLVEKGGSEENWENTVQIEIRCTVLCSLTGFQNAIQVVTYRQTSSE